MAHPDIRKDKLYEIPMSDGSDEEHSFLVNAKYDRIDHYAPLGIWIMKMLDDEQGMIQAVVSEEVARKVAGFALLPIVEREFLYESEHEMYLDAVAERLDDIFGAD